VIDIEAIRERFLTVAPHLDERGRRLVAAAKAYAAANGCHDGRGDSNRVGAAAATALGSGCGNANFGN
jgi:hypothetical protein